MSDIYPHLARVDDGREFPCLGSNVETAAHDFGRRNPSLRVVMVREASEPLIRNRSRLRRLIDRLVP